MLILCRVFLLWLDLCAVLPDTALLMSVGAAMSVHIGKLSGSIAEMC